VDSIAVEGNTRTKTDFLLGQVGDIQGDMKMSELFQVDGQKREGEREGM
jgi:hypothetical protein